MLKQILLLSILTIFVISLEGVTQLTDSNFDKLVKQQQQIWLVLFAADWCGHCKHLKPQIQKIAPRLQKLGVKVGHVDQKNNKLVNDYVVDHTTHMVSYPKMKIFLGSQELANVPPNVRSGQAIYQWVRRQYNLSQNNQEEL